MKKENIANYEYLIVINNDMIEVMDLKTGTIERGFVDGNAVTKKNIIHERLELFRKNKKIIVLGEPFIFYKEIYEGENESKKLFDPEYWKYKKEPLNSFRRGFSSVKYYSVDLFREFSVNTIFIDFFKLMAEGIRNRKNESKVLVFGKETGKFQVVNENCFSKINGFEFDKIQKVKITYENIDDDTVAKIGNVRDREYIETVFRYLKLNPETIRNDSITSKIILGGHLENLGKGLAVLLIAGVILGGIFIRYKNVGISSINVKAKCAIQDLSEITKKIIWN